MTTLAEIANLLDPGQGVLIYNYNVDTSDPIFDGIVRDIPFDFLDFDVVALRAIKYYNAAVLEIELNYSEVAYI